MFRYTLELAQFVFPLMGRIGTEVAPDVGVALIFGGLVSLLVLTPLSLFHELTSRQLQRRLLAVLVVAITLQIVVVLTVLEPFDEAHPKRM